MKSTRMLLAVLTVVLLLGPSVVFAELKMPAIFSDNMVLQRDKSVPIWGWAEAGADKASTSSYDFIPKGKGETLHGECVFEREQYPEDLKEKGIELNAAPANRLHMRGFLAAVENRSRPVADIEEGHISTASCILANVAMQVGRALVYDPKTRTVAGDAEATRLLRRPYRSPWMRPKGA